jgi:predicted flap endonuclease-1-like 5' DNA nuclease
MRTDYLLYAVAIVLFIITGIVAASQVESQQVWIVSTAVIGIFFAGWGYSQRPKATATTVVEAPPPTPVTTTPAVVEPVQPKEVEVKTEPAPKPMELTAVKGIKKKRAEQLKALGIMNANDLINASAEELATKLKIAKYFPEQWIKNAKELLQKT